MTLDGSLNEIENRLSVGENKALRSLDGSVEVYVDDETGETIVEEKVSFQMRPGVTPHWESYSQVTDIVEDLDDEWGYSGGETTTPYGMAEAHLVGNMCVLTGMVRRKAKPGATSIVAGKRYNQPMLSLPDTWRPWHRVNLPVIVGNTNPETSKAGAVGTGWIEVRPNTDPMLSAGRVYLVSSTITLRPGTGWVALQGTFPAYLLQNDDVDEDEEEVVDQETWDNASDTLTWNQLKREGQGITWNSYPEPPA